MHCGDKSLESKAISAHLGRDKTLSKITERFAVCSWFKFYRYQNKIKQNF